MHLRLLVSCAILLTGCLALIDEAQRPGVGDPCDGSELQRCESGGKSACVNGRWTIVECRGPRGCSSFSLARCDQRIAEPGQPCDPGETWTSGTCTPDGSASLACAPTGVFEPAGDCPGGCTPQQDELGIDCR